MSAAAIVPSAAFKDAAQYLSNASSLSKVSNATKLELYGLFKYLTVSSAPNLSRPSIFDLTARAKWDAWNATAQTYGDRSADAEGRYLEIARSLSWRGDKAPPKEEEDTWISDSDTVKQEHGSGVGEGMGNSVSVMSHAEAENTMSRLAISGDVQGMRSFLDAKVDVNLNEADENGYTPLHLACDRGNLEVAELLLSRGSDKDIKDSDDFTALELAQIAGHDEIVALLESTSFRPG